MDITVLKGIAQGKASLYHRLGIYTINDLLYYFPRSYIDLTQPYEIFSAPLGIAAAVRVRIMSRGSEQHIRNGLSIIKVIAFDDSGKIEITFFNTKYLAQSLTIDEEYFLYGKITESLGRRGMSSPMIIPPKLSCGLMPVYSLTAGLTSKTIHSAVKQAILVFSHNVPETLAQQIRNENSLIDIVKALKYIHTPNSQKEIDLAKRRLIFEELFILSLVFLRREKTVRTNSVKPMHSVDLSPFYSILPFSPTNAQLRCISEVCSDMQANHSMNRLIQGDVGSGKTLVAAAAIYFAFCNGYQSVMMVPTEILAQQHYKTLTDLLKSFNVRTALLTGSMKTSEKNKTKQAILDGEIDFCVGTHALLTGDVNFQRLSLVITDEQHRFGVAQRTLLSKKGTHLLVMSATPIPRTLALIIYGDLSLSVIDELPPNRKPIQTYRIDSTKRTRAFNFIKKHLDMGLQSYIVCPLIEQGETDIGLKPALEYMNEISNEYFQNYKVGLLHGKMKAAEKESIMNLFKSGEIQLLVSTTVIEVGVDVPRSVIMLIENAERFGLSQLHQLRGRVGRGDEKSYCILLSDSHQEQTLSRINVMCKTNDGFKVAQYDLDARGPGDFFGLRQHGLPIMKIADLATDMDVLKTAQEAARNLDNYILSDTEKHTINSAVQTLISRMEL